MPRLSSGEDPILVEPKALVRRLTRTATRLLEAAVAHAAERRDYEIVVEQLLLEMLRVEDGDSARLLHQLGVDRLKLLARVERALRRTRKRKLVSDPDLRSSTSSGK